MTTRPTTPEAWLEELNRYALTGSGKPSSFYLALQELWSACEQMKREFMLIDDGFFTGLVPPELGPVCQILNRLALGNDDDEPKT